MADNNFDLNNEKEKRDESLLEIFRTPDRERAAWPAGVTVASDVPQTDAKKQSDKPQEDRSFPNDIQQGFYIRADHRGDQHIYADSQGKREIFQATSDKLRTKINDTHAVKLMLDTAAYRGWSSVQVKGTKEFRREAWLEGQARGITVSGYKPTELDLQELKNREQGYLRNEIIPYDRKGSEPKQTSEKTTHDDQIQAAEKQPTYRDGIEGILIEQGQRPFKDNPNKDNSPYIVVQDAQGKHRTLWGVGLPDAILKAGAEKGDHVRIREAGMETVTKNIIREVQGRSVRVPYQVQRRAWEAKVVQERNVTQEQSHQEKEQHHHPSQDKESHENTANREVSRSVAAAGRSLHVGHGRVAALENGVYANEARAKLYMAAGRAAAGKMPELKNAAAVEAYIERKIKQKYPNDPVLLQRVMQTARNKIGHAVARGFDFTQPRVIDRKEIEKARQNQDQNKQQDPQVENEQSQKREQNREHDRAHNRSR